MAGNKPNEANRKADLCGYLAIAASVEGVNQEFFLLLPGTSDEWWLRSRGARG